VTTATVLPPRQPEWPPVVGRLAACLPDPGRFYLVGGTVRDVLRGLPLHDIDLTTPDDGLQAARHIANALGGNYYPVDPQRRTGRAILPDDGRSLTVDVATFRGQTLQDDLAGRDFTINALAVQLDRPSEVIDPLGGYPDLITRKRLRQCHPDSITRDPIRALRAVRQSMQFSLRIEPDTLSAVRSAHPLLLAPSGKLAQPERVRDEFFRMLSGANPSASLRLLATLGLLAPVLPYPPLPSDRFEHHLAVIRHFHHLVTIISAGRDDNTAAGLVPGLAVMVLDRFRAQLQEHLGQVFAGSRPLPALAILSAITPAEVAEPGPVWTDRLRLSSAEERFIAAVSLSRTIVPRRGAPDARQMHRYYRQTGEAGVTGVLLMLAEELARQSVVKLEPERWGDLLEGVASPLLTAFFRRHQQIVTPPPLVTGTDLMAALGLRPGPHLGALLELLIEAQAAGEIHTKSEALHLAERLATDLSSQ
jgi:hypothetical protein